MKQPEEDIVEFDRRPVETLAESERNARVLFSTSVAAIILGCGYYGFTAVVRDPLHLYQGLLIMVLATLPGLLWAKNGGTHLPMFEVYMLTTANTFGLPLLSGHESLKLYTPDLITDVAFTVILFQLAALLAYFSLRVLPGRGPFYTQDIIGSKIHRYIGYGLTITTVYTCISIFTNIIPYDMSGGLRAIFSGIGLVAVFSQSRRWGLRNLSGNEKIIFSANLILQILIQFSTLFLVGGLSTIVIGLLGYISGSRKLPLVPFIGFIFILGLLHNGKSQMRALYWDAEGNHSQPSLSEFPAFYTEWVTFALTTIPGSDEKDERTTKLLDRTSLFHLLCLVQSISPAQKPFLNGDTYTNLPAQFVPRFFWPEKPLAHASTYQMSVYYGLQRIEDTARTTIGFGMPIEAYVNFGLPGIIALGLFLGAFYKLVHGRCSQSPLMSYGGLYTIVLIAWSFQTELPLSMWLSSMFQACVAIMGVPFALRNFIG
jgi:hypothetical protein